MEARSASEGIRDGEHISLACASGLDEIKPQNRSVSVNYWMLPGSMPHDASILASDTVHAARQAAVSALLAKRTVAGHWIGKLSSSALSTATALTALRRSEEHTS